MHPFPLVEVEVADATALMDMIQHGFSVRTTAATGVHDASSRSHAVLRVYIYNNLVDVEGEGVLTLVDLAGSEHRIDSMHHTAQRRKEVKFDLTFNKIVKFDSFIPHFQSRK